MNNKMYDALENCLQAIEQGRDIDSVLARYPDLADELRPILKTSVAARGIKVPGPSAETMRRGRANLLQRAAELRESKSKVASRPRMIPVFQRLAVAFAVAAIFLASGTGLVRASASALPGENLYPVKRSWEGLRLIFVFDAKLRDALQSEYEIERLHEVNELLAEGRHETIQFVGALRNVNGVYYVSGIHLVILDSTRLPAGGLQDGTAVVVTGRTNAEGFVEAEEIELLPAGTLVPVGNPIELEMEQEDSPESSSGGGSGQTSGNEAGGSSKDSEPETQSLHMEGTVEEISNDTLVVNGQIVYLDKPEVKGVIVVGAEVKVEGYYAADGRFIVTKIEVKGSDSGGGGGGEDGSSGSSDNTNNDNGDDGGGDNGGGDNGNDGGGENNGNDD